ncbi:hypothetical protein ACS0TY_014111 [Phlomoides rotata]
MDFHSMKRKQLQALCKKHNIPANLSNLEMANRISELLKGKEDPLIQRPIEGHDEHVSETESAGVIVNNKVKKVRFSPEHELIEFSRSPELKGRSRRNMAVSKSSSSSLVNVSSGDMNKEKLGRAGRAVRSRGLKSMEGNVNENRGKNPKKGKDVNTNASAIEILDDGKSKEGDVDSSGQVMLLRGKILDAVDDEKIIEKIVDNPGRVTRSRVQKLTQVSTLEENRGRKVRKTTGNVAKVIAENKENKAVGSSSFSNRRDAGEVELAINPGEREKSKGKSLENKIVEEQDVSEPQVIRRSKRNTHMVVDSEILYVDKRKNENGEGNDLRKKSKLMATNGSGVDGEGNGSDVNPGRGVSSKMGEPIKVEPRRSNRRKNVIEADELKAEIENGHPSRSSVQQLGTADESSKDEKKVPQPTEVTRKSRRKTLSVKLDSADETETKRVLRGSVPELGIAEDSKDEKKVLQPTGVTGRSRRKTLSVVVSADDKVHTQLAVEKLETETGNRLVLGGSVPQLEIAGEVSKDEKKVLQPTITSMSRSKTSCLKPVDEENDTNLAVENLEAEELKTGTCLVEKECSAVQQSTRRSRRIASQCKSPGEIGRDSDKVIKRKRDVMNTNNVPSSVADTIKETSSKKAVPAASSGKVADSGKRIYRLDDFKVLDASSNNAFEVEEHFVIKEGLGSTSYSGSSANTDAEGTHGKKPDASIADNVESSDMKLINGRELVGSDTNAAPSNTEFEDDQVSVSNIRGVEKDHSPLDIDVHELLEQNITDMDKNGPEAHVLSEAEDLGCNSKKVLPEGSNVSGSEGFDEIRSSTDSFLSGDQTDINTVMEVRESKLDGCLQPSPNVVDCVGEAKRVSVEENLGSDEPRKDNQVHPECSKISEQEGLAETTSSADNPLPGDQIYIKTDVEVAEVEAEKCLQSDPCVVGELKVIAAQENLNSDETRQDGQVLPEVSNDSGKEGSAETGSSADIRLLGDRADIMSDPEVAQAEAVKCLQPSSNVVDHVGVDIGVSIQEKLDLDETGQDDQALPEVTNDSGKEDSAETGSFADSRLHGDQTDITNDAEVAQAEAVKCLQPSPNVVDHVGVDKGVSIQENLDLDETEQDGQALPEVSNDSGKEGSAETGSFADSRLLVDAEVAQAEAVKCLQPSPNVVDHVGVDKGVSIQENLDLDETEQDNQALPEVSNDSGKEGSAEIGSSADIRLLGDQTDITTDLEVAPSEADKCSQSSPNVVDHVGVVKGVSVQGNLDLDETRKENQGGSNVSGNEGFALTVSSDDGLLLDDQTDTKKVANVEGDYRFQPSPSEVDHEVEGMSVQENLDFDETKQAYICSPVSCHRTDVDCLEKSDNILDNINEDTPPNAGAVESCERPNDYNHSRSIMNLKSLSSCGLRRLEGDDMTEGNEAFFHKLSSELTETDEGGSLDIHKSASYRDSAFGIPDFSDGERSAKVAPQDNLKKDHEVHILENCTDKSSNSEDGKTVEGEFCHKNKCDEHGQFSVSNLFKAERRSGIMPQDKEAISDEYSLKDFDKSSKDEDWEFNISNLFDGERSARIKDSNKQVAIPDVPVVSTTCENYNEGNLQEICPSKLVGVSESQAERPESPLADTTAVADIILLPETCCSSIETAGNAMCLSKTNIVGSSAYDDADDGDCGKEKDDCSISEIGVEGPTEMKFQDAEETEEQSLSMLEQQSSPVTREEPNDVKNTQSWTEIELHNLFGTMFDTPGPNDASSSRTEAPHPTSMNKSISKNRDSLTKKEIEMEGERSEYETGNVSHAGLNVDSEENQLATPIKKDETWSHGSGLDRPVPSVIKCSDTMKENVVTQSKSDEKDHHTGFELESVEMVNISTTVLPEASEEQLTEKTVECLKETTLKIEECEEEKAIPLRESCLYEAPGDDSNLTQRNCIGSSGSPRNLAQIDGCQDLLTDSVLSQSISCKSRIYHATEGDMAPCGEAVFGLSGADLQRSNLPEKSNHLIACSEDGNILRETPVESFRGPLDAEVADISIFGGTSPCPFSKFMEFDEVTKRGDSVRKDNDLCGTNSRSSQDISDDIMEGDHDMIGKAVEESVTASMVQFSIPQLHFKEQAEDFNIPTHNISDVPPPECTEILKESDVADTIKEYIDSESSLSMVSENSSVSFPIDETTHTDEKMAHENAALSENNEDAAERFMNTEDEVDYLETESKEPEDSTAMEPLIETKGFDIKLDSQKQIEADGGENSSFKQLCSTAKKNARTILIHGTPGKLPATADMKENAPMHKSTNVGDLTTVRPAKRKALRDVRWK